MVTQQGQRQADVTLTGGGGLCRFDDVRTSLDEEVGDSAVEALAGCLRATSCEEKP